MSDRILECDVLVVGKGLAGGTAALICQDAGLKVLLVHENDAATSWAQGGIVYKSPADPHTLIDDVMEAGCNVNSRHIVEKVVLEGPELVESLLIDRLRVPFGKENGAFDLTREAAHSARRILHVNDETGKNILDMMNERIARDSKIESIPGTLVDLVVSNRHSLQPEDVYSPTRVNGAYVWTRDSGVMAIKAKATILATGGFASLFSYATGPSTSYGAGIAAAHRAGARTLHMEYVQFHPTVLYAQGAPQCLLTEALRGEGAIIRNHKGENFVDSLAPRDVVSRAMHDEMARLNQPYLFLDVAKVSRLEEKFPAMIRALQNFEVDFSDKLIPIVPAAHYTIGGVWTDEAAATSLPGLWACGEVACTGLHGANRLASMSLLEALVFGNQAGESVVRAIQHSSSHDFPVRPWTEAKGEVDSTLIAQDWAMLRKTLWNYVGLVRSEKRLKRAERLLADLRNDVETFYKDARMSAELISLRHGVLVATLCLYAAIRNRQSIGTHYLRENY
jgi:L-aspartate oxidase